LDIRKGLSLLDPTKSGPVCAHPCKRRAGRLKNWIAWKSSAFAHFRGASTLAAQPVPFVAQQALGFSRRNIYNANAARARAVALFWAFPPYT